MALRVQSPDKRREKADPVSRDQVLGAQLLSAEADNEEIDFCTLGLEGRRDRAWGQEEKHLITKLKKI